MDTQTGEGWWLPLSPVGASVLDAVGAALPPVAGRALLGMPSTAGVVPGATPIHLGVLANRTWWLAEAALLQAHAAAVGITLRTRWAFVWGGERVGPDPCVLGIVNVTPDSFSDGGRYAAPAEAVAAVRSAWAAGARWVDIGAESTRPGHTPVAATAQLDRLGPVLEALSPSERERVSVDTRDPVVAEWAIGLGVGTINDVSGGTDRMTEVLAATTARYVLMFNRAAPWPPGSLDVRAMLGTLSQGLLNLRRAGVAPERVVIDPGLGFGYGVEDNLTVLAELSVFRVLGRPLLVGASRKRFIGAATGRPLSGRDPGSDAAAAVAVLNGADIVRAHRADSASDAVRVAARVMEAARV